MATMGPNATFKQTTDAFTFEDYAKMSGFAALTAVAMVKLGKSRLCALER